MGQTMKPGTTGVQRLAERQRRRLEQHLAAPISGSATWGRGLRNNGLKKKCADCYRKELSLLVHMGPGTLEPLGIDRITP